MLYCKEVNHFIELGYAKKVNNNDKRPKIWYLSHFGIYKLNKHHKIGFVFDAAGKIRGISSNDQLDAGPDLLQVLPETLMRFRQYSIAVISDIKGMFLRTDVIKEDRGSQMFLSRGDNRDREPDVYEDINFLAQNQHRAMRVILK